MNAVAQMCDAMERRGPDDDGIELVENYGSAVVLGNRRLAVIDPSANGHQPMRDKSRGTTLVFNGTIYNFRELRDRLRSAGAHFVSTGDTEVVLRAYQHWGADFVANLEGMFALAIWDERERHLLLARDRLGIKPLYYTEANREFLFASQVKALLASGRVRAQLSPKGVASYLAFGAVSEPHTALEEIYALPPGHLATLREGVLRSNPYWTMPTASDRPLSRAVAVEELRELVTTAVKSHLVADVPIGVFLSGGLDSSIVAAVASAEKSQLTTLSVDFEEEKYSEAEYIQKMTGRLAGEHFRVTLRSDDLAGMQASAFKAMDQPSADGVNTYVVSQAGASCGLKVALSGLGADELFDGYGHVERAKRLEFALRVPRSLRRARHLLPASLRPGGDKLEAWLAGEGAPGRSYEFIKRVLIDSDVRRLLREPSAYDSFMAPAPLDRKLPWARQIMDREVRHYLGYMLLRDADAMSMANSLEVRVPFLDDRLVSWAAALPANLRRPGRKALLIEAMADLVPIEIRTRPKRGFMLPYAPWLRGPYVQEVDHEFSDLPNTLSEIIRPDIAYGIWKDYLNTGERWVRAWSLYSLIKWARGLELRTQ